MLGLENSLVECGTIYVPIKIQLQNIETVLLSSIDIKVW